MTIEPKILLVGHNTNTIHDYVQYFLQNGYSTHSVRTLKEAKCVVAETSFDVIILDYMLPDGDSIEWIPDLKAQFANMIVIVVSEISDISAAVRSVKYGAETFLTTPLNMASLITILAKAIRSNRLGNKKLVPLQPVRQAPFFGHNTLTIETLKLADIASKSVNVVLLLGDTGTGKGVYARWIHDHSSRSLEPFVEVNCSSLKGELLKSELFGHARGAFTSAIKEKEGLLEIADKGTLFLDEIGDMDSEVQTQLLKTIEEKSFRRIGETKVRHSNFRLICATNQNILEAIPNEFRRDLYYRISVFPINLHSLKAKKDEIPSLCEFLLRNMGYAQFPLEDSLKNQLQEYSWPGNVRELRNMLERSIMLAQGGRLNLLHFPGLIKNQCITIPPLSQKLGHIEDIHIQQIVRQYSGDMLNASSVLGISVSSLYRRLSKIRNISDETGALS